MTHRSPRRKPAFGTSGGGAEPSSGSGAAASWTAWASTPLEVAVARCPRAVLSQVGSSAVRGISLPPRVCDVRFWDMYVSNPSLEPGDRATANGTVPNLRRKKSMKYLYYHLGETQPDSFVVAHLHGSAANVILLDPLNFDRYRFGQPFVYAGGGFFTRTPVRLRIPRAGHWLLVIDCGGYAHRAGVEKIEVLSPDESPAPSEADAASVGASA